VLSVLIATLAVAWLGLSPAASYLLSAAGLVLTLLGAAGPHPALVWSSVADGPQRLLTETLPISGSRAILVPAITFTWLCGAASAELVARGGRTSPAMFAAALGVPPCALGLSLAASSSAPGQAHWPGPVVLASMALAAAVRVCSGGGLRRLVVGAAIGLSLAVALGLLVPALPLMSGKPVALRRQAQLGSELIVDPLDEMAQLRNANPTGPARTVMTVTTSTLSSGYLAIAILDDYDGATWSLHATFELTGGRVPPPISRSSGTAIDHAAVIQHYHLDLALPVPLLPALDRPIQVAGIEAEDDAANGMLMPMGRNTAGISYTAVSAGAATSLATVPPADGIGAPAGGVFPTADTIIPTDSSIDMATVMRFLSNLTGQRPAPTVAFLQAAEKALETYDRRVVTALPADHGRRPNAAAPQTRSRAVARPTTTLPPAGARAEGTSLSEVINAVTVDRSATPEQFATLFAMVARYLGCQHAW
jgi:hypothetical protein